MTMSPLYRILILYAITHLTVLVFASPDIPILSSRENQHLLGNTCQKLAEIIDGKDGMMKGGDGWADDSCYNHVEEIHSVFSEQPSQTTKTAATAIDRVSGPVTPRATLQARAVGAGFVPTFLDGGSTTDVSSLVNAAQSQASVVFAASLSNVSQQFQATIQQLQISASSAIFQANVTSANGIPSLVHSKSGCNISK